MGKVFRSAVFGGFKKKEVIDYLETLSQERKQYEARVAEDALLQEQENARLSQRMNETEGQLAARRAELEALRETLEREAGQARQAAEAAKAETEAARKEADADKAALLETIEGLKSDKIALAREKVSLSQEKDALGSRVLDFEDERRLFEAERQRLEQEMIEQRRELENRIFDLEAEVLESLEGKKPVGERSGNERAIQSVRELARCLRETDVRRDAGLLEELHSSLEIVGAELARLAEAAKTVPQPEPEVMPQPEEGERKEAAGRVLVRKPGATPPPKETGKLGSVRDILRHVRKLH